MLSAVDTAWKSWEGEGKVGNVPTKLITLLVEVHKAVMQRMNAKYGLDGTTVDLTNIRAALAKEMELVDKMIEQENLGVH